MKTYKAGFVADAAIRAALVEIERAAQRADPFVEMQVLHAEPERVRAGMYVTADGVNWQPDGVNGEGLYRRDKTNASWVFIG